MSFIDGFNGYNQIMPFGNFLLHSHAIWTKNANATYQQAITAVFHDMMRKEAKDYVDTRDIVVDPDKVRTTRTRMPLINVKELKSLMGKLYYIRRFISGLAAATRAFASLLRKWKEFVQTEKCNEAYQQGLEASQQPSYHDSISPGHFAQTLPSHNKHCCRIPACPR